MIKTKLSNFPLRYLLGILILALTFIGGYLRIEFIINLSNPNFPFLIERDHFLIIDSSNQDYEIAKDPRLSSIIIYTIFFTIMTLASVWVLFKRKKYVYIAVVIYSTAILFTICFFTVTLIFPKSELALDITNKFKNTIQEPFLDFLIIAYCFFESKQNVK